MHRRNLPAPRQSPLPEWVDQRQTCRPLRPAETAAEYAAAVTQAANASSAQSRLARRSAAVAATVVRRETPHLAHALESALYAPSPDSSPAPSLPSAGAVRTDRRLWSALRRLWLARWGM
jgi:hypothetical protein